MTIELEPRGLTEVRPRVVSDEYDVEGAMVDIATLAVEDADSDPDRFELVAYDRPGEDDLGLWFG